MHIPSSHPPPCNILWCNRHEEGDNDKDVGDSDKELVTTIERDFKRQARLHADYFEKLLEATCPNHTYPVRHKLKEYIMMMNYMTTRIFARGKKPEGDPTGKATAFFPEKKVVISIYGGPSPMSPDVRSNLLAEQSTP
jgi:hypothetical protein